MKITHQTGVEAENTSGLTPAEARDFFVSLPPEAVTGDATLTPVMGQVGHQRDPVTVLRGLRVSWTSEASDFRRTSLPGSRTDHAGTER